MVCSYYTPSIPATILSPGDIAKLHPCRGYLPISNLDGTISRLILRDCRCHSTDLRFDLHLVQSLLFTEPLIQPTATEHMKPLPKPSLHGHSLDVDPPATIDSSDPADPPDRKAARGGTAGRRALGRRG